MNNRNYLDIKTYELDISVRACNVLIRNGYKTVEDILKFKSKEEILSMLYFSRSCGAEVAEELMKLGVPDNVWYEFLVKTS